MAAAARTRSAHPAPARAASTRPVPRPGRAALPAEIAALGLLQAGHAATGVGIIVAAKVLGTAVAGRLFVLLEPQLREFAWFVRALDGWHRIKVWVGVAVRKSRIWRAVRAILRQSRGWLKQRLR